MVLITSSAMAFGAMRKSDASRADTTTETMSPAIEIATVGSSTETAMSGENSWPGEIVSLDNLQVQPGREGTIAEWYVRIGEHVGAGQVLGTLSRPPQTPEIVSMLSQQSEDLAKMRTAASAQRVYNETRIAQLKQLRADTERSTMQKQALLGSGDSVNSESSLVEAKKIQARTLLRGTITKTYQIMSGSSALPATYSSFQLRSGIGAQNSSLRDKFAPVFFAALADLNDVTKFPEQSGLAYFDAATKLANVSLPDASTLMQGDLDTLKETLSTNQGSFAALLGEIKDAELESVNTQKDSIDKLAEIDASIADLEKTLAVSEGEVAAKETAFNTVSGSINQGYSIVAPRSGVVSSIMKKPGEFVGPGVPVAIVTGGNNSGELVRLRIPNNVQKPSVGAILSIVRPGFSSDAHNARLVGVGTSLDETGSYMADAVFDEKTSWSIGASVRAIIPTSTSTIMIKHSSIAWDDSGKPHVWGVTSAGRIFKQTITVGRMIGENAEVYQGISYGDQYVLLPTSDIHEDMLVDDAKVKKSGSATSASSYDEMMRAMGM